MSAAKSTPSSALEGNPTPGLQTKASVNSSQPAWTGTDVSGTITPDLLVNQAFRADMKQTSLHTENIHKILTKQQWVS
jgi:hypothetical protein